MNACNVGPLIIGFPAEHLSLLFHTSMKETVQVSEQSEGACNK